MDSIIGSIETGNQMKLKQVSPTTNRLSIYCSLCDKAYPEENMFADLDVTNRYICQTCAIEITTNNGKHIHFSTIDQLSAK